MSKYGFTDTAGRKYKFKVTIPRLQLVRDELEIDLGKPDSFIGLSKNPLDVVNVFYLMLRDQANEHGLTDVQFGESFDGDVLEAAWEAFSKAYLSFCPSRQRKLLQKLMASVEQTEMEATELVVDRLQNLSASLKRHTNSPPSSESTWESTASDN